MSLIVRMSAVVVADHETRKKRSRDKFAGPSIIYRIFKQPGHVAGQWELNHKRISTGTHCGKMGNDECNCFDQGASTMKRVSFCIVEAMTDDEISKARDDKKSDSIGIIMEEGRFEVVETTKRTDDGKPGKTLPSTDVMESVPQLMNLNERVKHRRR